MSLTPVKEKRPCYIQDSRGRPLDLPHRCANTHLPSSPAAPRRRHPNAACMHEQETHSHSLHPLHAFICVRVHTHRECRRILRASHRGITCLMPSLVRSHHRRHRRHHPGRESQPFVKCPPPHWTHCLCQWYWRRSLRRLAGG